MQNAEVERDGGWKMEDGKHGAAVAAWLPPELPEAQTSRDVSKCHGAIKNASRVEVRRGGDDSLRFRTPLIEPDVRVCRIRLSDWLSSQGRRMILTPAVHPHVEQTHDAPVPQALAR